MHYLCSYATLNHLPRKITVRILFLSATRCFNHVAQLYLMKKNPTHCEDVLTENIVYSCNRVLQYDTFEQDMSKFD